VYDCRFAEDPDGKQRVDLQMTLTAPGCGMGPVLAEDVRRRLSEIEGVGEVNVDVVFDPPWNPNMMTEAAKLQLGFL
ncbi:MAG: iron-sulfur cluster assembly protein, partial [Thermoanaerobaculia bacterium]